MKTRWLTCLLVAALLAAGISTPAPAAARADHTLTVFAAASLTDAFQEIADNFTADHPDVEVVLNFGGSSTLAAQLSEGAPADVFASANTKQMNVAVEAGRIAEPIQVFARNRLVVAMPKDNPAKIEDLTDLAKDGVLLVLAAPDVPVRTYTDAMLEKMAADEAYGEDYRQAVLDNVVSEEPNVRQVVAKIALGEADAGVVYLSDITPDIAPDVITIAIPDEYNTLATYPIALTNDAAEPELAQAFVDLVLSDAGQDILVHWGFISIREDEAEGEDALPAETEVTPTPTATPGKTSFLIPGSTL